MAGLEGQYPELYPENVAFNSKQLYYIRSTVASISGAIAGVLGLTNLTGFAFYFLTSAVVGLVIVIANGKREPSLYFKNGAWEAATAGLGDNALGYILWWTLFYGVVHIYE